MTTNVVPTRTELLERIRAAHGEYLAVVATIPEDALTTPNTVGSWSIRDVIAHIGADEQWMAGQLEALRFEQLPTAESCYGIDLPPPPDMDWGQDGRNAWQRERLRGLSLDDVRAMARESHARLLAVISTFEDAQVSDLLAIAELKTVAWIRSPKEGEQAYPLWEWLRGVTYKHYEEHADMIRNAAIETKGR